ncbi:hypothetical protein ACFC0S_00720 [Streptomyces sp. NPDC056084]|uniref:hypothetical protein n=1 Tax=unclassified Streptomyces TaxID=2593676 RepID=UPI0035E04C59
MRLLLCTCARRRLVLVGPLSSGFTYRLTVNGTTDPFPVAPTLARGFPLVNN